MDRRDVFQSPGLPQGIPGTRGAPVGSAPLPYIRRFFPSMLHITCDVCGKELRPGEDHYVVKIEVFATLDPAQLTEADLEQDHMEAVSQLLREQEETDDPGELEPASRTLRFDLCPGC